MTNLAEAMRQAWEYDDWVYRKAKLSELNASERSMRLKRQRELAEMMRKYGPKWDEIFAKGGK